MNEPHPTGGPGEVNAALTDAGDLARRVDRHVGGRIRERRLELGLTQQDLAALLQISYQQVQKYETGSNRVSAGKLYAMAQALDVRPGYFFEYLEGEPPGLSGRSASDALGLARACAQLKDDRIRANLTMLIKTLAQAEGAADDG